MVKQLKSGTSKLGMKKKDSFAKSNELLGLTSSDNSIKMHPKSFRLSTEDLSSLKKIVNSVNEISRGKISETKVLQGMIYMCSNIKSEKLLTAIRKLM